jgi:hypothetical protein
MAQIHGLKVAIAIKPVEESVEGPLELKRKQRQRHQAIIASSVHANEVFDGYQRAVRGLLAGTVAGSADPRARAEVARIHDFQPRSGKSRWRTATSQRFRH